MDTTALEKAIERLRDILKQERNEYVRDGVVQRFEFTFELCWKALKRVLALEGVDVGSPKQTFREAYQAGLIEDVTVWFKFLNLRNLTVHTYNEEVAEKVATAAEEFPDEAEKVLVNLKKRLNDQ